MEPAGLTQASPAGPVGPAQTWASQVMDKNVDLKLLIECVIGRSYSGPCDPELWEKLVSKRRMDGFCVCDATVLLVF